MDNKITIIEGPPPTFEVVQEGWVLGLNDGPNLADLVVTHLRTINGAELVRRCYNAWHNQEPIYLEFRTEEGLFEEAPVIAARYQEVEDGQMLILWVRLERLDIEIELDYEDDLGDLDEDDEN
jgi:hypothetical protein